MHKITKHSIVLFVILTLTFIPFGSAVLAQEEAEDVDIPGKMAVDILLARPIGIISTVLGTALFIISLPFSALGGNTKQAYENLIAKPAKYTFKRPLGNF
jgi:hypothetical protein